MPVGGSSKSPLKLVLFRNCSLTMRQPYVQGETRLDRVSKIIAAFIHETVQKGPEKRRVHLTIFDYAIRGACNEPAVRCRFHGYPGDINSLLGLGETVPSLDAILAYLTPEAAGVPHPEALAEALLTGVRTAKEWMENAHQNPGDNVGSPESRMQPAINPKKSLPPVFINFTDASELKHLIPLTLGKTCFEGVEAALSNVHEPLLAIRRSLELSVIASDPEQLNLYAGQEPAAEVPDANNQDPGFGPAVLLNVLVGCNPEKRRPIVLVSDLQELPLDFPVSVPLCALSSPVPEWLMMNLGITWPELSVKPDGSRALILYPDESVLARFLHVDFTKQDLNI